MITKFSIEEIFKQGMIFKVRKELGLTQVNLAKLCGVTNTYIRIVEIGVSLPTSEMQERIFEALGIFAIINGFIK